jgi:alginate O-acetyltransferase complex protein AlgI
MVFNSFIFWFFFAAVIFLYIRLPHRGQNRLLLVASYIFYGYWDYRFLALLLLTTTIDFFVAQKIYDHEDRWTKKLFLTASLVANFGVLGLFKYYQFFSGELLRFLHAFGIGGSLPVLNIILPVGLSFYTFQEVAYTIDVYRGKTVPTRGFLDFALYTSFFPQLVAGPIERPAHLLPQILMPRTVRDGDFSEGFYHIINGLFRKVVVADNLAPFVNHVFSRNPADLTGPEALIGIYAFAFQIYGDFSGYSLIAKGLAKWMGIDLMTNFRNPYFAVSPSDFWQRWHISLSSWLRDYLYIPLGGNRSGVWLTYRNLLLTMVLGGLWHGAAWTYVVWGAFHGFILVAYRALGASREDNSPAESRSVVRWLQIGLMFHLVCLGWLFFRAESLTQAFGMLGRISTNFDASAFSIYGITMLIFFAGPLMLFEWWTEHAADSLWIFRIAWWQRAALYAYCGIMLLVFPAVLSQIFIYFQF